MTWKPDNFEVALQSGPKTVAGHLYGGLGLHTDDSRQPKGRKTVKWILTHANTGHSIAILMCNVTTAFCIATEFADAGEWDFLSLQGYADRFPNIVDRCEEIASGHPTVVTLTFGMEGSGNHEVAKQIAANRP